MEQLLSHSMDLALHVVLVALDLQNRVVGGASPRQDQALLSHVVSHLRQCDLRVSNVVCLAELIQAHRLSRQSCLDLEDVEQSLSPDLARVRLQEQILARLKLHLVGKSNRVFELEVLEQRLRELSE